MRASIRNLENQISQLTSSMHKIEANKGRLLSQAEINPKENASVMTLRSGKEVQIKTTTIGTQQRKEKSTKSLNMPTNKVSKKNFLPSSNIWIHSPFPGQFAKKKKKERDREWNLWNFLEGGGEHSIIGCYQTNSTICQISQRVVHQQKKAKYWWENKG